MSMAKNVHGIKPHMYMHVKYDATHWHAYVYKVCYEMILLMTSSALSFVIYACRNFHLGGILTDTLGHLRCTAFVATCRYIANIYISSYRHNAIFV